MNEIEKMYGLANIEPLGNTDLREMKILVDGKVFVEGKDLPNNYYNIYPSFTAEKQLSLIKWLVHKSILSITIDSNNDYHVCGFGWTGDFKADFNEAIASYINNLWQDLTEEECKQVKGILE